MTDADVVGGARLGRRRGGKAWPADEKLRRALRDFGAQVSPFITTKIPTEFEDDDTVAPWADFTPENQAAKLAELECSTANTGAGRPAMPPPPPVPKSPPRVSQSSASMRTPPRPPGVQFATVEPSPVRLSKSPGRSFCDPPRSSSPGDRATPLGRHGAGRRRGAFAQADRWMPRALAASQKDRRVPTTIPSRGTWRGTVTLAPSVIMSRSPEEENP